MSGTLEGHWPLAEDSGSTAYDYSGNENHGTLNGGAGPSGTGTVTGPFGNSAYDFDGADDEITLPSGIYSTNEFSASAWVYPETGTSDGYILEFAGDVDGQIQMFNSASDWRFGLFDGSSFIDITTPAILDAWQLVTGVYDGSTIRLYFNGMEKASASVSAVSDNTTNKINNGLDSGIADVRAYSRALSPQEVQALYQAGVRSEVIFNDS